MDIIKIKGKKMKKCSTCNVEKDLSEFSIRRSEKDGLSYSCRECSSKRNKKYTIENRDDLNSKKREYYLKNKEEIKRKNREYYHKYKERDKGKKTKYVSNRRKIDHLFNLRILISQLVGKSLNVKGYSKRSKTQDIIGISYQEFKQHLESKFEPWMSWENHGKYNRELNYGWDIDHIIPLCSAKTYEDIIKLNHYTNLQPLCSRINRDIKKHR